MADAPDNKRGERQFRRWQSEISNAQKDSRYKQWLAKSQRITDRYRDERNKGAGQNAGTKRYNILWANVQTLGPAIYGKMPKPVAERRFLDRDPAARLASLILERVLAFQMQIGNFHAASQMAIHKDYLLPGMGQMWVRYEPEFKRKETISEDEKLESAQDSAPENSDSEGFGEPEDELAYETLCFDHVNWKDFLWKMSRTWPEVPWVGKRCWLDYIASEEEFGEEKAKLMTFGDPNRKEMADTINNEENSTFGGGKKAEVWEIWCKTERKVYFIAPESPAAGLLKEEDDPLKLEGFWPCPPPLFATQTNDTVIPVPDYVEYQDQAAELDDLTDRMDNIISAVRVNGVYDSQWPALQRLLQKGQDNLMLPVEDWAKFTSEGGGIDKAISLVPIEPIIMALQTLTQSREQILQDVYQITGISDIIRGQTDAQETATAQKIKANYATGRLGARQQHVADFCVNTIRIAAELIAEIFSDASLRQMSGIDQLFADQVRQAVEAAPEAPKPQIPPNAPPAAAQQATLQWQAANQQSKQQAGQQKQAELEQQFQAALALLRSDKLRGFRVDIETDSTIADDLQQDKQAVMEFMSGMLQSIEGSMALVGNAPELLKPLAESVMWSFRRMRAPRTLESAWEDSFDRLEKRMEEMKNQPPPPDPEMIKAESQAKLAEMKGQIEQVKSQADVQATQLKSQAEQARAQADIQVQTIQLRTQTDEAQLKSQIEQLKLQLDAAKNANDNFTDEKKAKLAFLQAITVAQIAAGQQTDAAQLTAQVETILGFANIQHEATQAAMDREHEQGMTAVQQDHERTMQKAAPKPVGGSSG